MRTHSYRVVWAWFAIASSALTSCGDEILSGVDQPLIVSEGTFRTGGLPGTPPGAGVENPGPRITSIELAGGILRPWQQNRRLAGRASDSAFAVAVQMADEGSGYWVVPVGGPDPLANNELGFEVSLAVGDVRPGRHRLRLVAIDAAGDGGPQRDIEVCVASELPDNLNVCDPSFRPPDTIVTLTWDRNVDLDLVLVGPGGVVLDGRRPVGAPAGQRPDASALADPTVPRLVRDSNAACRVDGQRRESVVFPERPTGQTWLIYARLYDACGEPSARARLEVFRRVDRAEGQWDLVNVAQAAVEFLDVQAAAATTSGTYLLPLTF